MTEYYKQERKLDVTQTRLINNLARQLAKKVMSPEGCFVQTLIEVGITEFVFEQNVEFSTYKGPTEKGDLHERVADSGTPGE